MHSNTLKKICLIGLVAVNITACTPVGVATSVGAVGGIAAAREGGLTQSAIDTRIAMEINDLWFKYDIEAFSKLSMTIDQGRVLVTGVVQDPDMRVEAVRLAWQPNGVLQVINEVRVDESDGVSGYARDTWITSNLRSKLIFDRDVQSINYSIDTVKSTIYLMGVAQDQPELNKVVAHARETGYAKQVVSYVKMAGEPVDGVQDPIAANNIMPAAGGNTSGYNNNYNNVAVPSGQVANGAPVPVAPSYTPSSPRDTTVYSEPLND